MNFVHPDSQEALAQQSIQMLEFIAACVRFRNQLETLATKYTEALELVKRGQPSKQALSAADALLQHLRVQFESLERQSVAMDYRFSEEIAHSRATIDGIVMLSQHLKASPSS